MDRPKLQHLERPFPDGGWKGALEFGEVLLRKIEIECSAVLAHMLRSCSLRNGDDSVLPEQPGERHLRWRGAVMCRDVPEFSTTEQPALLDGRVSAGKPTFRRG